MSNREHWRRERRPRRRPPKGVTRPLPADLTPSAPSRPEQETAPPAAPPAVSPPEEAPRARPPVSSDSVRDLWLVIALLLLATATFLPALTGDFVWEDYPLVVDNPLVRSVSSVGAIFAAPFLAARPNSYHPLVTLTYLTDYQVWRLNPQGYHTTDLTLHLIATLLVYAAAMVLLRRRTIAFVAGALFAVHPAHVQAVAWISGRAQPLATCLALFSFLAYGSYVASFEKDEIARRWRTAYHVFSVFAFTLALFAHAAACALLVLLPLYEIVLSRQRLKVQSGVRAFTPYVGFAAGGLVYLLARWWALGYQLAPGLNVQAWPAHLYAVPLWTVRALELLLLPVRSSPYYATALPRTVLRADVLAALAAVVVIVILAVRLRRITRAGAFAVWWALLTLAPALNLVPLGAPQFAERNLYLPSAGCAIVVGWAVMGAYDIASRRGARWARGGLIIVLAWLIALGVVVSWQRESWYRDDVSLFRQVVRAEPGLALGHFDLANAYLARGDTGGAIREYQRALRIRPATKIYHNLGNAYMAEAQYEKAAAAYREALAREPSSTASSEALIQALEAQAARSRRSAPPRLQQPAQ